MTRSASPRALLTQHGLVGSMRHKGNCLDKAVMERFFWNLQMECVWQRDDANHAEAMRDIADYIMANLQPNTFRQQSAIDHPAGLCEIT